jgi:Dictyostelium (slime mold) repeat
VAANAKQKHFDNHNDLDGPCDAHCDTICGDRNLCTTNFDADNGSCETHGCYTTPQPVDCDDGDLCTANSCDPLTGCVSESVDCDDNNSCTSDSCDSATGDCVHDAVVCSAGEVCNTATGACEPEITETCFTGTLAAIRSQCNAHLGPDTCCKGLNACQDNVFSSAHISTICTGSCNGERACAQLGDNVVIKSNSCNSKWPCEGIGQRASDGPKLVEGGSCNGEGACWLVNRDGGAGVIEKCLQRTMGLQRPWPLRD